MSDTSQPTRTRRLWLVRHGVTPWSGSGRFCGHTDVPLTGSGRAQARWVGRALRQHPIAAVHTSDLARARETAHLIAAALPSSPPVVASTAWRELGFGHWEGLTYTEIARAYHDELAFFSDPERYHPPGGESLAEVWSRVQAGLAALQPVWASQEETEIVLVSHGGTLRLLLCRLLALPVANQWRLRLDLGSISAIDVVLDELPVPTQAVLALLNMTRPQQRGAVKA